MSITQISTDDQTPSLNPSTCPRCGTQLPGEAVFCNACGERLDKVKDLSSLLANEEDIASRYRMTSLVRRRPYVTLYFAQHLSQPGQAGPSGPSEPLGQSRMVALRDIDLSALDASIYRHALEHVQREYDLLRRSRIPHILPVVDLRSFSKHLYTIAVPPGSAGSRAAGQAESQVKTPIASEQYLSTLQDFLQSGLGLPSEQRVLQWMDALCTGVDALHSKGIVIGDLDPYVILLSSQSGNAGDVRPLLMVSWLPPALRALLPQTTTATLSYFIAPESMQGAPDARSDVYSLGAILYLLLTGTTPGDSTRRGRSRLRPPQEINARISHSVSECVMQALAINPDERFQSAAALAAALHNPRFRRLSSRGEADAAATARTGTDVQTDGQAESETVRIIPLSRTDLARWRAARSKVSTQTPAQAPAQASTPGLLQAPLQHPIPPRPVTPRPPLLDDDVQAVENDWELSRSPSGPADAGVSGGSFVPTTPPVQEEDEQPHSEQQEPSGPLAQAELREETRGIEDDEQAQEQAEKAGSAGSPLLPLASGIAPSAPSASSIPSRASRRMAGVASGWKQRVTGLIPALSPFRTRPKPAQPKKQAEQAEQAVEPTIAEEVEAAPAPTGAGLPRSWWERFKQMVLGEQQQTLAAAAIIETPLRVLPDQMYTLRINIMGREQPDAGAARHDVGRALGLSRLAHGDIVLIEVRSVLQQSYAYIVQQATVSVPAEGYVAEVVIPLQPLSSTPIGRRDRLHIFFLNEHHHPLYEKPFAVEVFVSHHVKHGGEGHYTLPIPY